MISFYVVNIVLSVFLNFWPVWFSMARLRLPVVNPFTILFAIGLPIQLMKLFGGPAVLMDDGLLDVGYQYAVLMSNLQVVFQVAGLLFFYKYFQRFRIDRHLPFKNVVLSSRDIGRVKYLFLVIFLIVFYLLASAEFGVLNWLINPRQGYQLYRTGQGHWYALAVSSLSVSYLAACLEKPIPKLILGKTFFYVVLGYLLGSKGTLLAIFGAMLVFLWFVRWRHLARMIVLGAPLIFSLMLVNLYLALSDGFDLQAVLEYFDYYKNAADYYNAYLRNEIDLFYGEVNISALWGYIPRVLWPSKPVVYGMLLVNEIFYPGQAELTNTPAFGGAVEQFADFGVVGVIIFSFFSSQSILMALFSYLMFKRPGLDFHRQTLFGVALLLVQFAPAFGSFFPGMLYFTLLMFVLLLVCMMRYRRSFWMRSTLTLLSDK